MPAVPKASEPSRRSASAAASPLPSSRSSSARVSGSGSASRQAAPLAARLLSGPVIAHSLATSLGSRPRPHPPPPAACCRRHPARSHPPEAKDQPFLVLSLIHISEPTRLGMISYAVFCLKKKKNNTLKVKQHQKIDMSTKKKTKKIKSI